MYYVPFLLFFFPANYLHVLVSVEEYSTTALCGPNSRHAH